MCVSIYLNQSTIQFLFVLTIRKGHPKKKAEKNKFIQIWLGACGTVFCLFWHGEISTQWNITEMDGGEKPQKWNYVSQSN